MRSGNRVSTVALVRRKLLRIEVRFDCASGELRLEYAADAAEARHFAAAMIRRGYRVLVDREVRPGLRPLPCRSLWHYA
ncbi:hypothetical protein [Nocardia nova]|uniref:hypothetical protein n=1 Tax=Nocardia nova TaxID=37330 RepID=UPI0018932265|nr:hypothetical protein [Nocardia nova]MBF6149521.1 hypothetical protein [Nocardia nova]